MFMVFYRSFGRISLANLGFKSLSANESDKNRFILNFLPPTANHSVKGFSKIK